MPHLVELLTKTNAKTKSKIKPTQNFLLQTLKELSPKKAIDFLKSLNLDKKEIKDIILKLPKNAQSKYLNILEKEFLKKSKLEKDKKEELKTEIKNLLKELDKKPTSKITEKDDNKNEISHIMNTILTNNSNTNPKTEKKIIKIKKDILEIIKKEIDSNKTLQNLLNSKKTVTEIKNASSFKELVEIANKNGLNIKKIITEIIKPKENSQSNIIQTKNKLNLNPIFNHLQKNINIIDNKPKNILENLLSDNKKEKISSLNDLINHKEKEIKKHIKENKTDNYLTINNMQTEIKTKIISAKETLRHFSANLKDAIENYKPPVSKISLELNPKELGKVDVTLIKRGDNLQIQINSNHNAINLFHTNQNDLKNTLVNMGFSGVDMQFNSNQNNKEREQKAYKQYSQTKEEEYDELIIEMPYQYA